MNQNQDETIAEHELWKLFTRLVGQNMVNESLKMDVSKIVYASGKCFHETAKKMFSKMERMYLF